MCVCVKLNNVFACIRIENIGTPLSLFIMYDLMCVVLSYTIKLPKFSTYQTCSKLIDFFEMGKYPNLCIEVIHTPYKK
jgi:hypothetical protein